MATHVKYKAKDYFDNYFEEKIWSLIPEIYKVEDGSDRNLSKGALRAFVKILSNQAAILRRSQDDLWNDQFISLCHEWAVPYIADLLGTRLISSSNKRGRRVDVAKTVYFRRRKGTLPILEQLISDISGWEGTVIEQFKSLSRNPHGLDIDPMNKVSRVTRTLPGGLPNFKDIRSSELVNGPFDEFNHLPDVRKTKRIKRLVWDPQNYISSFSAFFL